ncbi:MAG: hypothetical protein GY797_36110 [Deltaproteobacteria bacterium]|nr:hypothetical protein [Deltaproteobacteria bacterium]
MKIKSKIRIPGGLRFRIMLPAVVFTFIFTSFFIVLNNHYTSKILDERLEREAVRISKILNESQYILNPVYLKRLGEVIEGRIAVFDSSDNILAASFDETGTQDFLFNVNPKTIKNRHIQDSRDQSIIKINNKNKSFLLVTRKLFFPTTKENIIIAILTPLDDLQSAKSQAAFRTILSGSLALLIAFIAAGLVLKKISSSMSDILIITDKIASGNFSSKAAPSDIHELNTLASSINSMSDKLMGYEKKLVDSTQFRSINKITAAMAHEIKNPLSSMKILAQIIQNRFEHDKEGSQMADAFIKEINRIDNLVSDLRGLKGPSRISFSRTQPHHPLKEVIAIIKPKLDHLNIHLRLDIEPDIPELLMDADKIKQVLWNLMMNGTESMPHGGSLLVSLKKNNITQSVEYSVTDNGSGIDPKNRDHIFTPFFSTKKEGIGMGLHVSKEIANAHKGKIELISTDPGTKAVLSIPCNTKDVKGAA